MAEHGTHITITAHEKPSIFDVIAQETLLESLHPALKHIFKVLAEKNPSEFGRSFVYADEIFFFIQAALQFHYLSNYGASFAENFYGLKRVPLDKKLELGQPLVLHFQFVAKSLFTLTAIPYIRHLLNKYYQVFIDERTRGFTNKKNFKTRLKSALITLWPKIHLLIELTTLFYYLRYLTGKQKIHSPLLQLSGLCLSHLTEQDIECLEERTKRLSCANIKSVKQFIWWILEFVGTGIQNTFEVGAFFLQFLDWFYLNNSLSKKLFTSSLIPLPPQKRREFKLDMKKCPLCAKERVQETVLAVSGYVFCYSCILQHIRQNGSCPVTRYLATPKHLIKIYRD